MAFWSLLTLALSSAATSPAVAEGLTPALDFSATALDGTDFSGQSLAGRAVLLDFWGTWCAPCVHAFPKLQRLHEDFGDRLSVVGLAYYSGEAEDIAATAAEHGLEYTVLAGEEETLDKFNVLAFPSYVLISPAGEVIFSRAGQVNDIYELVAAFLTVP